MRVASIDIGTNTILLLIADVFKSGIKKILHDEQVIARLGKGVDSNRIILPETFERAKSFLLSYEKTCNYFQVEKISAVGTSALRDAKNSKEFCNYIFSETGISIEIISGDEEAQWTYLGGISDFLNESDNFSVLDIGGGSTEIITGNRTTINSKISLDMGSVRITERFLKISPPSKESLINTEQFISSNLSGINFKTIATTKVIAVAGTATTLATIDQNLEIYNSDLINGYNLSLHAITNIYSNLKEKTLEEIKSIPQISQGRTDIILAGILVLKIFMEQANIKIITVSDKGLRFGIVYRIIEQLHSHSK